MPALHIKNLQKTYRNGFTALKGIDLTVKEGDFFALLGPNGAGKSTTIGIVCSLVNKTAGSVKVYGHDLDSHGQKVKAHIGLVPQEFNFNIFETVWQIVLNQAGYYGLPRSVAEKRADKYLHKLGLWDKRHHKSQQLSGGMKRRLMIARALLHEPELLILDEPTAGVDIEIRRSMWAFFDEINRAGKTVILTTHYLEEAEQLCKNIAIIDKGHIIEDTSIKTLLAQLHRETFLLDLANPITEPPPLDAFSPKLIDSFTLEVEVEKSHSLNRLFEGLSAQNIEVLSLRNRTNRLEELFMNRVAEGGNHHG